MDRKDLTRRILRDYAELIGRDPGLSVRHVLKLADREAVKQHRPEQRTRNARHVSTQEDSDFLADVVGHELERRGFGTIDWSRRDTLEQLQYADRQADIVAERTREESARERVAADVLARLPNAGEVRVTAGRLADDALHRAREQGKPADIALDPVFVRGVAKEYFSGHLGARVLDD